MEPSLDLAMGVERRGHEVLVVTGRPVGTAPDDAGESAEARALTRLSLGLSLRKHVSMLSNRRDAALLSEHLRARAPDVLVATLRNDHRILRRAVERAGLATPIVRLWFEDGVAPPTSEEAALLRSAARVVAFGARPAATLAAAGVAKERIATLSPPLDVDRVRRSATATEGWRVRLRAAADGSSHGPGATPVVVGLVARVQPRRRFDLLWEALRIVDARGVPLIVAIVGRGTHFDDVARRPVDALGIADRVRFLGYLRGEDYASALAAMDAQLLLVPGSDPTVRALREGMALGVPSIATRAGLLPDLVEDGRTGVLVDDTPESLGAALEALARATPAARRSLGAAAADRAEREFALPVVAERLEGVLASVADLRGASTASDVSAGRAS